MQRSRRVGASHQNSANDRAFGDLVFLTQTDTTIGLLSQNAQKLTDIKQRPPHKHYIRAIASLKALKSFTRVPQKHKNRIRRSQKTTFIFPNGESYRIIRDKKHLLLVEKFGWLYTTSANLSGKEYDEVFAKSVADVVIESPRKKSARAASSIFKLNNTKIVKVR